ELFDDRLERQHVGVHVADEADSHDLSLAAPSSRKAVSKATSASRSALETISVTVCTYRDGVESVIEGTPTRERWIAPASVPPSGRTSSWWSMPRFSASAMNSSRSQRVEIEAPSMTLMPTPLPSCVTRMSSGPPGVSTASVVSRSEERRGGRGRSAAWCSYV